MAAEMVNGAMRTILLTPRLGDFAARQVSVFTGSVLILAITCFAIRHIPAATTRSLLAVGAFWLVLTVAFELGVGRLFGRSWQDLAADYQIWHGGLLPIGLAVLALAPLIAARVRGR
jgi:hypothetical protein